MASTAEDDETMLPPDEAPSTPSSVASVQGAASSLDDARRPYPKDQIWSCLADIKYAGEFMCSHASQCNVDPGLHVNNVGNIRLPLGTDDASMIMNVAAQAPFGRGTDTVIDTSFRNTRQLDVDSFQLRNPAWTDFLQDILTSLSVALSIPDSPSGIKAELYKLLLYEEGALFKPHRDSEKAEGMFGTLVVCLPSKHEGGDVVLTHHGKEAVVKSSSASDFGQTHIAWYSDVLHEIKPVTTGYRLVLTYNLLRTHASCPPSAEIVRHERAVLQELLKTWRSRFETQQPSMKKLAYFLDHEYSTANLRFDRLKGHDRLLGLVVKEACDAENITPLLASLSFTISNIREDEDEDERTEHLELRHLVNFDGREILDGANILKEELVQTDRYDRYPDRAEHEETGNEGVDSTHFYHDTVLLLLPQAYLLDFKLETLSNDSIVNWTRLLIDRYKDTQSESAREDLIRICTYESQASSTPYFWEVLVWCIKACKAIRDPDVLLIVAQGLATRSQFAAVYDAFVETLHTFSFDEIRPRCVLYQPLSALPRLLTQHLFGFDEMASYDSPPWKQYQMLSRFRFHYQSTKSDEKPLTEWPKYNAWEISTIKDLLNAAAGGVGYQDAFPMVKWVEYHQEELSETILTFVIKHSSNTAFMVAFLADMYARTCEEHIPDSIANRFFNESIKVTVAELSLDHSNNKKGSQKPYWWTGNHKFQEYEKDLGKRISRLYALCHKRGFTSEASCVLEWLDREAEIAHLAVFPYVLLPFLKSFRKILEESEIPITPEIVNLCISITTKLSDWSREPRDCKEPNEVCKIYNAFLVDPDKAEETFADMPHCHLGFYENDDVTLDYPDGISAKTRKFTKTTWTWKKQHSAWQDRLSSVKKSLPFTQEVKDLYGDRWDDMQTLIWTCRVSYNSL